MLELKGISKSYKTGDFVQHALKGVDLKFRENEFVAILGPSGSGKTTLLNIIGGLDKYDSGDLIINNKSTKKFKKKEWDAYRNNCIGFIFQSYNLITHISVLDNVEMGMTLSGISKRKRKAKALELLNKVGLKDHAHKRPNQLSGGQMQRVAIARALANNPSVILADEPTGALDSKTSIQIMELIKEISKDKLVIMVTHNPDLAEEYANRVVEFKDGQLTSDSNPIKDSEKNNFEFKIKKTKMSFLTALNLSFNNIKTKKGRTFLTSFASSIGIIGIALILSLSNGFQLQIDKFEKDTLAQMPIVIMPQVTVTDEKTQKEIMNENSTNEDSYSDKKTLTALISFGSITHKNKIDMNFMNYLEDVDSSLIGGLSYSRSTNLNLLMKDNSNKVTSIESSLLFPLPESVSGEEDAVITDNFEVIYGKMSKEYNELVLLVNANNKLDVKTLETLGYDKDAEVSFDDILGKEIKVVLNDDYYTENNGMFSVVSDFDAAYNSKNSITLKITGIIRGKEGNKFAQYSGTGLCYKEALMDKVMGINSSSKIVTAQMDALYNVLTGVKMDLTSEEGLAMKEQTLAYLGAVSAPSFIQIFPKDFDSKTDLLSYLDDYNEGKSEEGKIIYTDYADTITSLAGNIMDAITIVLISFSAISLIVSSIMIGIIMYISVLERTKEIGILKALGARNKDITRVFNAETFIIGLFSGLLGLAVATLLCIPANILIEKLTDLENVAQLNIVHALILLLVSITLTLIGGFIPAKIASKKDPVEALRTE
jgi:putative ABC transport system permease protein